MAYGLTENGFVIKELTVIQAELIEDFQASFGADIDVSAESVAGQYIGNLAIKFSEQWELLAAVYASFNPDTNTGVSQDGSLALVGTQRLDASQSSAVVMLYGAEGTVIPVSPTKHLVGMDNGYVWEFEDDTAGEITEDRMGDCHIQLVDDPTTGAVYTITINSIAYSYTALVTDTLKSDIITALKALVDAGAVSAVVNTSLPDSETLRIYAFNGETPFTCSLTATLEYSLQGTPYTYLSQTYGAIVAPSGTINIITQSVAGLDSVNNLADATPGRATETDSEARVRRRSALAANSCGSDPAIQSRLLTDVDNVTYAKVYSNRTDATDGEGRPPHSFEAIVQGGTDEDIVELLWEVKAAGIQTFGTSSAALTDMNGDTQTLYFSRPEDVYIWVDVTVTRTTEEEFPADGVQVIKDAIIYWTADNIVIGGDIFYQRFNGPIYANCTGIAELVIEIGSSSDPLTPPVSYAAANIPIATREIGVFSEDRITVSVS